MKSLVWGTGTLVKNFIRYKYLNIQDIIGFVDSYRKVDRFLELPVFSPEDITGIEYDRLLICVLRDNRSILEKCRSLGLDEEKIFFVHNLSCYEGVNENKFNSKISIIKTEYPLLYEYVQEKARQFEYTDNSCCLDEKLTDTAYIKQIGEEHLVAWVPIELIFSERREDMLDIPNYTEEWSRHHYQFEDLPMISFTPNRTLYQFFSDGRETFPQCYCDWMQKIMTTRGMKTSYTDEMLIEKRYREYRMMMHEINMNGNDFLIEHPAIGKWNPKGYFNLMDGHHRVSFLYNLGYNRVPLQITNQDYDIWRNKEKAKKVLDIIVREKRCEFYQPILNPYFMQLQSIREDVKKSRLQMILEYFNNTRFRGKRVIDIGANIGYFGTMFAKMGADVTLLEPDPYHYELTKSVADLTYADVNIVTSTFEDLRTDEEYDIAIMLTVFYFQMKRTETRMRFIENLDKLITSMVIWESGDNIEQEKQFILENTKFKKYTLLGYTIGTGKFRELGIFEKE